MGKEVIMQSGAKTNENQDSMRHADEVYTALLRSEICFWKELIAGSDPAPSSETLERMQQARALAESRLDTLQLENKR